MKRSYQDFRKSSTRRNVQSDSSTQIAPIFIELEEGNSRNSKRPRKNDTLLNLLIRAIVEEQSHSRDKDIVDAKINFGDNIVIDASTSASTMASSTTSNSATKDMDSAAAKHRVVNRIPLDDRSLSFTSNDDFPSSEASFSNLPNGRPLLAPPRLPTHFIPGQIRLIAANVMPLAMTLTCEVQHIKTRGKRSKQTSVPLR